MFVSLYTILKQRLKIFWSSIPTNFSYEPPLGMSAMNEGTAFNSVGVLNVEKCCSEFSSKLHEFLYSCGIF
jgi:hypothetical protein